jgi:type II secretory pathway component GspD/PulD (secretin)
MKMNSRTLPLGILAALSLSSQGLAAKEFECNELLKCMEAVYQLNGDKYYTSEKIKGKISLINLKINERNVDSVLSGALYDNGYVRVKEGESVYKVVSARNARYNTFPVIKVSAKQAPVLPQNYDFYMMEYKLKHPRSARVVTKNLRPFLSRYGRVVAPDGLGRVIIQDNSKNLNRMYNLVSSLDQKIDKETLRRIEKREQRYHAVKLAKTRNCSHEKLQ